MLENVAFQWPSKTPTAPKEDLIARRLLLLVGEGNISLHGLAQALVIDWVNPPFLMTTSSYESILRHAGIFNIMPKYNIILYVYYVYIYLQYTYIVL